MQDNYESDSESIDTLPPLALHETASELISLSPTGLFHKILPVGKIEDFADKSQRYALQKGVNFEVLMQFFGLILMSSYYSVLNENHFWSAADDVCVSIVPRNMSRNKFKNVKRYFQLVDYSKLKKIDLMGKIKPLYDYLNEKLLQFRKLSIDKSMVPYYGHPSSIIFICVKQYGLGNKYGLRHLPAAIHLSWNFIGVSRKKHGRHSVQKLSKE
ncbi:PiggyBac transposable element-derived protein 3 [Trichinella patagoniensis]|uniref:PiggyBac transposable element-derived protein 3 n=1 Tax=Trichinella patagoniensis TaxID=990121 RepID=A0A0V0ZU17_9BILA|nr:PiggyBac transposable element-derived protein 3 [Trichinella patagoniensis]